MMLMKVVLLIQYSNEKIGFIKIDLHKTTKIHFEIRKDPTFDESSSSCLIRCKQILSRMLIWMQKSIEFQLPLYEIPQPWSY